MTELDNGAASAAAEESALFNAVTRGTDLPQAEAAKPVETPAAPAPTPEPEDRVPSARLREEAEARRKAERELAQWQARYEEATRKAQPQEPQHKPDIFENASEFVRSEITPELQQYQQHLYRLDRRVAIAEHGKEKVEAAQAKFDELLRDGKIDEIEARRVMSSPEPFSEAVNWYARYQTLQEVGTDPAAYKTRLREELMKDPAFVAEVLQQARQTAPKVGGPASAAPNLPSLTRVGSATVSENPEPLSDSEMFAKATARKRR
jgi:Arc/MetJ-type ribon-helix-helix transcriptional regulator